VSNPDRVSNHSSKTKRNERKTNTQVIISDNLNSPINSFIKVWPWGNISSKFCTRCHHLINFSLVQNSIPKIESCHFSLERLNRWKFSSQWILLLAQNQYPISWMNFKKWTSLESNVIFIDDNIYLVQFLLLKDLFLHQPILNPLTNNCFHK